MSTKFKKFSSTNLKANKQHWILIRNEFIRARNCGEHCVLWQRAPPLVCLLSKLCKPVWPKKALEVPQTSHEPPACSIR